MEIMQIVGIGIVASILAVTIRQNKPEIAMGLSVAAGIVIFLMVIGKIGSIINILKELAERANLNVMYLSTILKIIAIAYIADFGAQICRDAGEGALAVKIEFAAKILLMILAVPIVVALLQSLLKLVP